MSERPKASLENPRAKLARAVEHFEALDAGIDAFIDSDPYAISPEREAKGWNVYRVSRAEPPPLNLGVILGDLFHNLRSALDNLVWQLVVLNGKTPKSGTGGNAFPVCSSPERFAGQRFRLKGVRPEHVAVIEDAQPYEGRDGRVQEAVRVVSAYSNIDKHQVIHPAYSVPMGDAIQVPTVERLDGKTGTFDTIFDFILNEGKPAVLGTEIARMRISRTVPPKIPVKVKGELFLAIAFGEGLLRADALPEIGTEIGALVERFAPDFDG